MAILSVQKILGGEANIDTQVTVKGWVRTRRDSKAGISFVNVSDGSCFHPIQVVAPDTLSNYADEIAHLTAGCSVEASGLIVPSPAKGQPFEMQASAIKVVGWVDDPDTYPIQPKAHSMEYLREVAHLRSRTNVIGAVTRVRHTIAQAIHRFFDEQKFFWVNTPIITASDAEGAGELFRVSTLDMMNLPRIENGKIDYSKDFFGRESFLTVSGQLNVETYCMAMSKVYTFGPTFRAENSNTSRHLAEFWMVEPEMAFCDLAGDMQVAEGFIRFLVETALEECAEDLELFDRYVAKGLLDRLVQVRDRPFVHLTYTEAVAELERSGRDFTFPVRWGTDLQAEHERFLCEEAARAPVIVTNYPIGIKPFYMRVDDDGRTVAAMDILVAGIGELVGGSQREERLEVLTARMTAAGLDLDQYGWYLDLRRYGSAPHAGFGLGFERLVQFVTGMQNIRDVIPFPRTPGSAPC